MRIRRAAVLAGVVALVAGATSASARIDRTRDSSQGVTSDTITIGATLGLSGTFGAVGVAYQQGYMDVINDVNAHGGVAGHKLKFVALDDAFDPVRSQDNVRRLVSEEKVFALLGPTGGAALPQSWPFVQSVGIPVFAPNNPPDPHLPSVFNMPTPTNVQQYALIRWLVKEKKVKTLGILTCDTQSGQARNQADEAAAAKYGAKIVATAKTSLTTTDPSSAILELKQANPDAVMLSCDGQISALVLKTIQSLGWHPLIAGDSSSTTPGTQTVVGPAGSAAEGLIGSNFAALPTATTKAVMKWRKISPNPDSDTAGFEIDGYGEALVFVEILKRMKGNFTWANFITTTEHFRHYSTGIFPEVTFRQLPGGHTGCVGEQITQYQNGKWVPLTKFVYP